MMSEDISNEVNWDEAPEGAEYYVEGSILPWEKCVGGSEWFFYNRHEDEWVPVFNGDIEDRRASLGGGRLKLICRPKEKQKSAKVKSAKVKSDGFPKVERYKDKVNEDWIDLCARAFTPEEFRGAMKFTIGKYERRVGKKDSVVDEVYKIADYAQRWLNYEQSLLAESKDDGK